jgi:hypothetical protein
MNPSARANEAGDDCEKTKIWSAVACGARHRWILVVKPCAVAARSAAVQNELHPERAIVHEITLMIRGSKLPVSALSPAEFKSLCLQPVSRGEIVHEKEPPEAPDRNRGTEITSSDRLLRGLTSRRGRLTPGLAPQFLCRRRLRGFWRTAGIARFDYGRIPNICQSSQNPSSATQSKPPPDRNKYALIINRRQRRTCLPPKQFQQWTAALQAALTERFGFAKDRVKLLTEKLPTRPPHWLPPKLRRFASPDRTGYDNRSAALSIGHGSFDKEAKFNLVDPIFPPPTATSCFRPADGGRSFSIWPAP